MGSADAAGRLVAHLREASPRDAAAAGRWAVDRIRLDDPYDLARLLEELRAVDADGAVQALLARDPANQVSVDRRWEAIELLRALHAAGAAGAVDILAARIVADDSLEDLPSVASLLRALHAAGATDAIHALVARDPPVTPTLRSRRKSLCCLRHCMRPARRARPVAWPRGLPATLNSSPCSPSPGW